MNGWMWMDLVKLRIAPSGHTDQPDGSEARPCFIILTFGWYKESFERRDSRDYERNNGRDGYRGTVRAGMTKFQPCQQLE